MNKVYGVYFAYSKQEVLPEEEYGNYPTDYPREVARICRYANASQQLDSYANTMCPASQLVTANSEKEFNEFFTWYFGEQIFKTENCSSTCSKMLQLLKIK